MARLSLADWPAADPVIKLPHPYLTPYFITSSSKATSSSSTKLYQLSTSEPADSQTQAPPEPLHSASLHFSEPEDLKSSELPPQSNNTAWARARRSPSSSLVWDGDAAPTLAQAWLFIYVLFTVRPDEEFIRLGLEGPGRDTLSNQLRATMLAVDHPQGSNQSPGASEELVLLRASFWQGAGSPFGARGAWVPTDRPGTVYASAAAPALTHMMTSNAGAAQVWHPRRAPKPRPGSTVYSRWVPHLRETFSMVALDHTDPSHLELFHAWQNDPRVSAGWDEAGTLDQHRGYLARAHEDPHRLAVLAAFDGVFFAYFETYWAREDPLGAYYPSRDFDRGRESLVGDVRYRGAHRVGAWWSSLMHYLFLDDPRTMQVVGDPKFTNSTVLAYDLVHGFGLDKFVDLPHKRGALMRCSRERFFQICPLAEDERERKQKVVGGTLVGLVPKL
ncbi:putative aerobactin siderophore biosynthesis protein iucb [Diaporthe ampelina]|uniref:Putative aerobactin siderophore biosynthesis protein iucb n=1 Tax=Diaporthe ampelina TaxID=1214573 RepID=A0A0G2FKY3_9PEZI|nr:putative aerobactin siderophore biosynthesis protein iucb [Diaporthe ampelina]